jgi:hypothetical protein
VNVQAMMVVVVCSGGSVFDEWDVTSLHTRMYGLPRLPARHAILAEPEESDEEVQEAVAHAASLAATAASVAEAKYKEEQKSHQTLQATKLHWIDDDGKSKAGAASSNAFTAPATPRVPDTPSTADFAAMLESSLAEDSISLLGGTSIPPPAQRPALAVRWKRPERIATNIAAASSSSSSSSAASSTSETPAAAGSGSSVWGAPLDPKQSGAGAAAGSSSASSEGHASGRPRKRARRPIDPVAAGRRMPNPNLAFGEMSWLDSVVFDDERPPRVAPNTDLILDGSDPHVIFEADDAPSQHTHLPTFYHKPCADSWVLSCVCFCLRPAAAARHLKDGRVFQHFERPVLPHTKGLAQDSGQNRYSPCNSSGQTRRSTPLCFCFCPSVCSRVFACSSHHVHSSAYSCIHTQLYFKRMYSDTELRMFHRPLLSLVRQPYPRRVVTITASKTGAGMGTVPAPMLLLPAVDKQAGVGSGEILENGTILASFGGSAAIYVPKKKSELTARDGKILLMEYMEEHPPLISNVGMGSRIVTYYRKTDPEDQKQPEVKCGYQF